MVSVATGERFIARLTRLKAELEKLGEKILSWENVLPEGSPSHAESPYEFKLHAIREAWTWARAEQILWMDSSVVPVAKLARIWDLISAQGYWISRNYDYVNGMFTADSAYPALGVTVEENWKIPHVVAGAWGINLTHKTGKAILAMMTEFARAGVFRGPWQGGSADPRVIGHRHDQTALSVAAWELGLTLTEMPSPYAEDSGDTAGTILVARRG